MSQWTPRPANSEIDVERHPDVLEWGFALEYSLIYLQSQVQDLHLRAPLDRLIPLVEFALETPLNRGEEGQTTGTINPGIIWAGKYFQVGVEAVVPINERTGNNVGVIAQLHFFWMIFFPTASVVPSLKETNETYSPFVFDHFGWHGAS